MVPIMSKFPTRPLYSTLMFSWRGIRLNTSLLAASSMTSSIRAASTSKLSNMFGYSPGLTAYSDLQISCRRCQQIRFYSTDLPEHKKVMLPALSPTMEQGTIVSWQKKEGDQLAEGDLLCEIETDKATMGFETPEEGYLAKILFAEGSKDIPIGKLLCIIVGNQEDVAAFANYVPEESAATPPAAAKPASSPPPAPATPLSAAPATPSPAAPVSRPPPAAAAPSSAPTAVAAASPRPGGHVPATPYAKKVAKERGIDLASLVGSGPGGRILAADIESATPELASSSYTGTTVVSPEGTFIDIPLSNMRKTIAKRLIESKTTIPHYYLTSEIVMDELMKIRAKLNSMLAKWPVEEGEKQPTISVNDFIVKASALACLRVPEANSAFMGTFIRQHRNVDVSVAVSSEEGLLTPIIFSAHSKGLATISSEIKTLAAKARAGKLQPAEFQGGTFTVSNLGMYSSIHSFAAIVNPPQSCILAIGTSSKKLVPDEDNGYKTVTTIHATLSCDHRVVDGAVGAEWLKHFKEFLEKPHTMLL